MLRQLRLAEYSSTALFFQGWLLRRTLAVERVMLTAAGLALVYPRPKFDSVGIGLVLAMQKLVRGSGKSNPGVPK